jgi:hypothetical protein
LTLSLKFSNERGGFPNYILLAAITNLRHLLMLYARALAGISTPMVIRINLFFLIMAPLNDTSKRETRIIAFVTRPLAWLLKK